MVSIPAILDSAGDLVEYFSVRGDSRSCGHKSSTQSKQAKIFARRFSRYEELLGRKCAGANIERQGEENQILKFSSGDMMGICQNMQKKQQMHTDAMVSIANPAKLQEVLGPPDVPLTHSSKNPTLFRSRSK